MRLSTIKHSTKCDCCQELADFYFHHLFFWVPPENSHLNRCVFVCNSCYLEYCQIFYNESVPANSCNPPPDNSN